ncbi:PREDICTED: protein CREG1 [Fulmarus glacialis]|uniref:protein CREG1 n=1 Tax=Fulmarus glacialis TaxID=30455 RepID=UPI00051C6C82|nr:PREDICTED: protein CREG1 [Fulmarus glacialis]
MSGDPRKGDLKLRSMRVTSAMSYFSWWPMLLHLGSKRRINSNASLTVSLAQTPYCKKHRYDPQNPLCAHIIFCGSIVKVNDSEAGLAKKALFSRHPEMESWPKDHNWFFAKFNITNIWVLDYFGGLKIVTPEEYYSVKP